MEPANNRQRRILLDCPPTDFVWRPFLEELPPDSPEHVLVPTPPDTAPLAWWTERVLAALQQ